MVQLIVEAFTQSPTGLPKDRFTNVWHFLDVGASSAPLAAGTAFEKIWDVYRTSPATGGTTKLEAFLAPSTADTVHLVAYNFADATPRPEIATATFTYTPGSADPLPEEVAVCLSCYTDRNLVSKRGRLYFGPFNINAAPGGAAPSRPSDSLRNALAQGGFRLVIIGRPASTPVFVTDSTSALGRSDSTAWALYSPKLGTFSAIRNGWVDDEWDSQRRRRVEASTRQLF